MIVHTEFDQKSAEWLEARAGIPTASEFGGLLTDKLEPRKWSTETPKSFLALKLAEAWVGPLPKPAAYFDQEQGNILEDECKPWLTFELGWEIENVGLITADDGRAGCSPDGLLENRTGGLEIKCPSAPVHVKYLLDGGLPSEYAPQVHGSLHVSGLAWWRFVSYRRRFPAHSIIIDRDEDVQARIADALGEFLARFDSAWQRLCDANGGPPPPRKKFVPTAGPVKFSWDMTPEERDAEGEAASAACNYEIMP